jgi:hypothetical protein
MGAISYQFTKYLLQIGAQRIAPLPKMLHLQGELVSQHFSKAGKVGWVDDRKPNTPTNTAF